MVSGAHITRSGAASCQSYAALLPCARHGERPVSSRCSHGPARSPGCPSSDRGRLPNSSSTKEQCVVARRERDPEISTALIRTRPNSPPLIRHKRHRIPAETSGHVLGNATSTGQWRCPRAHLEHLPKRQADIAAMTSQKDPNLY